MFTSTGMRATLKAEKENGIYVYNLGVAYTESLSTETNYCETDLQMYPDNLQAATLAKMMVKPWRLCHSQCQKSELYLPNIGKC